MVIEGPTFCLQNLKEFCHRFRYKEPAFKAHAFFHHGLNQVRPKVMNYLSQVREEYTEQIFVICCSLEITMKQDRF